MTDMIHHKSDNTSLSSHKKEVVKGGFIKFYRDFQDWHWYSDANVLQLYLHLMLTANFKDKPFKDIIVHRGEVVISHMRLAETLDKSKDQIRRLLNKLKRTNDITTTRIGCATLVRLINYNKYQGFEDITPDPTATCSPDDSHLITDYPPTTEERKQGNNVNNEKKLAEPAIFEQKRTGGGLVGLGDVLARQGLGVGAKFKYHFTQLPPDWQEVERYVAEKNIHINLEGFYSYYEANGWCERSGKKLDGWHFALCHTHKTGEYL